MVPFERTLPYDTSGNDVYVEECPFCYARNVQLPLKKDELPDYGAGKRKWVVFPCCYNRFKLVDADSDYLMADRHIRQDFPKEKK